MRCFFQRRFGMRLPLKIVCSLCVGGYLYTLEHCILIGSFLKSLFQRSLLLKHPAAHSLSLSHARTMCLQGFPL